MERTLGKVISERRNTLGLSLKDLGRLVHKEDGHGVSSQYIHDIERDRRTPSPRVLAEMARSLGVDPHYLAAVAGQCPQEILQYLKEYPEAGADVATMFTRARATGFVGWEDVEIGPKSMSAAR